VKIYNDIHISMYKLAAGETVVAVDFSCHLIVPTKHTFCLNKRGEVLYSHVHRLKFTSRSAVLYYYMYLIRKRSVKYLLFPRRW